MAGPASEVANSGTLRPPLVYLAAIAAGLALHLAWPFAFLRSGLVGTVLGAALVLLGIALFVSAVTVLRKAGTPVPGNRPTTAIVDTGAYRFTRNPIYLAFSLVQLGIAVWLGSVWLMVTLAVAMALMTAVVIPREERYLAKKFGAGYLSYKARVRRWL